MNTHKIIISLLFFLAPLFLSAADVKPAGTASPVNTAVELQAQDKGYLASEYGAITSPKAIPAPSIVSTTINLLVSLLFIIGLIYLVAAGLKFFYVKASIPMKSENVVNVIAREYVDSKTIMYVVEFAGKVLLLGNAGASLNVLTEITDKEAIDKLKQQADEYVSKYKLKAENRFDQQLKSSYLQQGKKLVNNGNDMIKGIMEKFVKKDDKPK